MSGFIFDSAAAADTSAAATRRRTSMRRGTTARPITRSFSPSSRARTGSGATWTKSSSSPALELGRLAGASARGVGGDAGHAPSLDADRRQGAPGPDAVDQSRLARNALHHIARADDVAHSTRQPAL